MAPKTQDAFEPARQAAEQMTERTQETITNYFGWLQNVLQATPWGNTELTKKLVGYAIETVRHANVAAVALANKNARIVWAMLAGNVSYEPERSVQTA
jgi:hypothetical protein